MNDAIFGSTFSDLFGINYQVGNSIAKYFPW